MDFMHDALAGGELVRALTVIDVHTRECVALRVARTFQGFDVARESSAAAQARGSHPARIFVDNGTEFTSKALDHWACWNRVELDLSGPGKPGDNAYIESFNGNLRRERLSRHGFVDLGEVQGVLGAWREDYDNTRPHRALAGQPPALYRAGGRFFPDRNRLGNSIT